MDRQYWDEALQGGLSSTVSGINPMVGGASASFDPIHMVSNWNLSRRKEAAARLAADSMAARSGPVGQGWSGGLGSGPDVQSRSGCVLNEESGGVAPEFCNFRDIKAPPAASLESLDCLLSATNSNTGASVEDDGISMLFSPNCKRLWSFSAGNAVSSGDSTVVVSDADPSDFNLISENVKLKSKKSRTESRRGINFQRPSSSASSVEEPDSEAIVQMKEMIYRAAAFRPVNFGAEVLEKPKRKNVRISTDPQTVAARQRRERISERIRALQRLVPGGSKMDTASMLDEAANYLKFLRSQVKALEGFGQTIESSSSSLNFNPLISASLPLNSFSVPMQPNFPTHSPNPIHRPSSSNSSQAKF